jgi:hypothetical protein
VLSDEFQHGEAIERPARRKESFCSSTRDLISSVFCFSVSVCASSDVCAAHPFQDATWTRYGEAIDDALEIGFDGNTCGVA